MMTIQLGNPIPSGALYVFNAGDGTALVFFSGDDPALLSADQQAIIAASSVPDPDAALRAQYEAEQQAKQAAEFAAFKARSGEPSYKAAAVKIAAEKLALTPLIDAALDVLINADGDKALLVWWTETDAISRGDAEWQRVEAAVEWPKGVTAGDLFDLAAQV